MVVSAPGKRHGDDQKVTDLLLACRQIAAQVELVGADVVEVLPDRIGSRDITALVAERVVREILTGMALQRVTGQPDRTYTMNVA